MRQPAALREISAARQHKTEIRCYLRDPDGYLIEVARPLCRAAGASF